MEFPAIQEQNSKQCQQAQQKIDYVKESEGEVVNNDKSNNDNNKHQQSVKNVGMKCSVLQLTLNEQQADSLKFSISHLTQSLTNQDWNSSTLSPLYHKSISPIKYFGFSEIDVTQTTKDNDTNKSQQQKYNRQLLLGTKSKLKREIVQENKEQKLNDKESMFLYVEDGLATVTKTALIIQQKNSTSVNFMYQIDFQKRLNIVIDILEIFHLLHSLNFTLFPHVLFPNEIQNSVLFTQNNQSKQQYQPHLKLSVHFLYCFKQNLGNSIKKFTLKEFISLILELYQNDKKQISFKSPLHKDLRSPEIKFYNEEWYWKVWDKLFSEYVQSQTEKTYMSNLVTPTWIDLFQIPFGCLKFLYGDDLIEKLRQKKYDEIKKGVQKLILNQKTKKSQNFQDQIIKFCQKPLIQWAEYEKSFKQCNEKIKKPDENKKQPTTTIQKSNEKDLIGTIITHPQSRKVFEQFISFLGFFPVTKQSKQKFEAKRCFSLSTLHQRLKKLKSTNNQSQKLVPLLIKSQNLKPSTNAKSSQKKEDYSQRRLTLLGADDNQKQLFELKRKYLELLGPANVLSIQQFQARYVKKSETHLLTTQIKKKLSTVFSTHNGIMKSPKSFTLVYKSSVFNFSTRKFYEFCENKSCLFYVIKVKNDKTLYYFNEEKINRARQLNGLFGGFIQDSKGTSFIYTGDEVLKVKNPAKSFGVSHICGPIIGQGDIIIKQGNIENEYHYPRSYQAAKKSKKLLKSSRLDLQQMDVYQLQF